MSDVELKALADLLEKLVRRENLTESERLAAMKLVNATDLLVAERKKL